MFGREKSEKGDGLGYALGSGETGTETWKEPLFPFLWRDRIAVVSGSMRGFGQSDNGMLPTCPATKSFLANRLQGTAAYDAALPRHPLNTTQKEAA